MSVVIVYLSILVVFTAAYWLGAWAGSDDAKTAMKREAVKNGHAVWIPDENGRVTFRWKNKPAQGRPPLGEEVP